MSDSPNSSGSRGSSGIITSRIRSNRDVGRGKGRGREGQGRGSRVSGRRRRRICEAG